jgi:cytoskeletal protein CcmA (bactofilin family)
MFRRGSRPDPLAEAQRRKSAAAQEDALPEGDRRSSNEGTLDTLSARGSEVNGKLRFDGSVQVEGTFSGEMLNALLGHDTEVNGKLQFEGTVRIDGTFTGEIVTNGLLIVGEGAKIAANISCGSAVVSGEVKGNITATDSVEFHKPARVKGDIATPSLVIDTGVVFDGSSRMMPSGGMNITSPHRSEDLKRSGLGV